MDGWRMDGWQMDGWRMDEGLMSQACGIRYSQTVDKDTRAVNHGKLIQQLQTHKQTRRTCLFVAVATETCAGRGGVAKVTVGLTCISYSSVMWKHQEPTPTAVTQGQAGAG